MSPRTVELRIESHGELSTISGESTFLRLELSIGGY